MVIAGRKNMKSYESLARFPHLNLPGRNDLPEQMTLFMGFPRQKYWNGLPFPFPGDLPNPETEAMSPASPVLAGGFSITELSGKPE